MADAGRLLLLSAASRQGLVEVLGRVQAGGVPPYNPDDGHRLALVTENEEDLRDAVRLAAERLKKDDKPRFNLANRVFYGRPDDYRELRRTVFLFPGFGARHPTLLPDLMEHFPAVRAWFETLPESARRRFEANPLLFPNADDRAPNFAETIESVLAGTLAMHALLEHYVPGLTPDAMAGHSYGETALLLASGMVAEAPPVLDLLERMMAAIGRVAAGSFTGVSMLAVTAASKDTLDAFRANRWGQVNVALDNCPQQAILCGPRDAMAELEQSLRGRGNVCFRLPDLAIPVHTPLFPVSDADLAGLYAHIPLARAKVPAYSCVSMAPVPDDPAMVRAQLVGQWTRPVRFRETMEALYDAGFRTFVEVGPGGHLSGFVRDTLRGKDVLAVATNLESRGTLSQLRRFLAQMFVRGHDVDAAPFSAGGPDHAAPRAATQPAKGRLEPLVRRLVSELLELDEPALIDGNEGFFTLGMGSLQAVELVERLQGELGRPLAQTLPFDHPTIAALAAHLEGESSAPSARRKEAAGGDIAIIGMGCRFPGGADTPERYWDFLRSGRDAIRRLPEGRWDLEEIRAAGIDIEQMPHIFSGGFLEEVRDFDCGFFGISPREAVAMDPQHRLLLEVSHEALEHAGIPPGSLRDSHTGVFVGISNADYAQRLSMVERLSIGGYLGSGNALSTAAGRLSFILGLNGPCLSLDTACSSSLVAVHLACRSLREGESSLALAAGVNLILSPETSIFLARAGALSRDCQCKTFDQEADGYVRSEGCGVVVLKRLDDASADGDQILAVIKGSAVNHDGRTSGFTVPSGRAQQAVVREALVDAGVLPAQVAYVETHGTGTSLGDPIEVHALGDVFAGRPADTPLLMGALKSNMGHLEAAAGIAGLMKTVLQLRHGQLVPGLHLRTPNSRIQWDHLPLEVVGKIREWPAGRPRIAGLSSFGLSGTNAHVILGDAPPPSETPAQARRLQLLTLSAASPAALRVLADETMEWVPGTADLADLCATSNLGRDHLRHRLTVVAADGREAVEALAIGTPTAARRPKVAFLFSGQGSQFLGMGRGLFEDEPVFRQALKECEAALLPHLNLALTDILFGNAGSLDATAHTQPALFALEYALGRLWQSWGIEPAYVLGHSIGEYAAACLAGVFSLEEGARLVAARGRLMQALPSGGAMMAVALGEAEAESLLEREGLALSVAAVNSSHGVVLSGPEAVMEQAEETLRIAGVRATRLTVSHAFHSPLMDPILEEFRSVAATISFKPGRIPLVSTLTGRLMQEPLSAAYWTEQLRRPVRFADGMAALRELGCDLFLEIGPRPVLTGMAQGDFPGCIWLASLQPGKDEQRQILTALAGLHGAGTPVDWQAFHIGRPWRRAALPFTPYDRQRLWLERGQRTATPPPPAAAAAPKTRSSLLSRLRGTAAAEQQGATEYALRRMVASALGGARPEDMDSGISLNRLGLDSLMALGLRNELMLELDVDASLARLTGDETIETLTAFVMARVFGDASASASETAPVTTVSAQESPLSYGQRALWFLWRLAPQSSAYSLSLPLNISGSADAQDWRNGCRALVARHPMLRSVFPSGEGEAVQHVMPAGDIDWRAFNPGTWTEDDVAAAHAQAFDLEEGPVVRFRWFGRAGGGALLLITMHHIVSDAWSLELIRRQLPRLVEGEAPGTVEGYGEHVRRQLDMLNGPQGERLWQVWRERLGGELPLLDLPTDFPRPRVKSMTGAGSPFTLRADLGARLKDLAKETGTTPYVAFLAAFLALLHRYSGQDDLLIGSPQAGRNRPELAGLVGYFVDPLVLRSRLDTGSSFRDFLADTRRMVLETMELADYPFALLVEKLQPERDPGRSPLFDVSFNFTAAYDEAGGGLPTVADLSQADGKFDLSLNLRDGNLVNGWFGYDTALFAKKSVERIGATFAVLLEAALNDPDRPLVDLPLAPVDVPVLKGRELALGGESLIHRRVAAVAAANPETVAVVAPDRALTYGELDEQARRLAGWLRGRGIGPESLVGIPATRTASLVVAILGIFKAGAAYVPLDTKWPEELLSDTLKRTGIALVLSEQYMEGALASSPIDDLPESALDDLAYVIFTSGSTGAPKGVAIAHRALANYVESMLGDLGIVGANGFALVSSPATDLGLTMLFPALASGGCLHILPEQDCLDGERFAAYLDRHPIDYLKIVPSHFAALTAGSASMPRKALVLGGEGASAAWAARLAAAAPECAVINHYGPTETTIGVLTGVFDPAQPSFGATLPLKQAVANSEIHLLDRRCKPVPAGAVGELYVGGPCLARGYVNAPEQTAQSFITLEDRRLYRTGDLGRLLPGGALEILGRRDRQVKIRGFRIEPGQVEAALANQPGIERCLLVPDRDGGRLLAFAVAKDGTQSEQPLLARLAKSLPPHMVPDRVLLLDDLPRSASGKADTAALLRLAAGPVQNAASTQPRDTLEMELLGIWREVLGVENLGIEDDFFRLGGHSLLAIRLTDRIRRRFGQGLPLATLLTHPTIRSLAGVLRGGGNAYSLLVPLRSGGNKPPLFLLPGAGGSVMYFLPLARHLPPDQPCWALQAIGHGEDEVIPLTVEDIAARYVELVRAKAPDGPYYLAGHSFGALVAFEMARLLADSGGTVAFLGLLDNPAPARNEAAPARSDIQWLSYIAMRVAKLGRLSLDVDGIAREQDYQSAVEKLASRLVEARIFPEDMDASHFARFIEIYKANAMAAAAYRPRPLARVGEVVVFRAGAEDAELGEARAKDEPALGWCRLLPQPPIVEEVAGTHLTMFVEPQASQLAERLASRLVRGEAGKAEAGK